MQVVASTIHAAPAFVWTRFPGVGICAVILHACVDCLTPLPVLVQQLLDDSFQLLAGFAAHGYRVFEVVWLEVQGGLRVCEQLHHIVLPGLLLL